MDHSAGNPCHDWSFAAGKQRAVLTLILRMPWDCALPAPSALCQGSAMDEIIFEVREDEIDGGFVATALGHSIATQGDTLEELREMVRDAVRCHFGDAAPGPMPKIIRLHFVRDEALAV